MSVLIFLCYSFTLFLLFTFTLHTWYLYVYTKEAFLPTPMLPILIKASLFSRSFPLLILLFNSIVTKAAVKDTNARRGSHLSFDIQGLPDNMPSLRPF